MEKDGRFLSLSLSSHYFWSNVRRKEHPFYLSFIPNRHTKEMLQHNGIAKCQIMFPSPSCARCGRQINIFPHSFFSHIFLSGQASFSFPLMRMPSALSQSRPVKKYREREGKNIACFSVIKSLLRDSWHGSLLSHLSHNRVKCWCVRWVRRRGVKSWREPCQREGAIRPHCWLMLGWLHEEPWVAILAHYITAHMSYCWGCFHHQPSSVKIMSQACCE